MAGASVTVQVGVPAPPPVIVAPAPPVTLEVGVPDYYVWDGVEFVGVVGTTYYYLAPGDVWIVCDPVRLARFRDWERFHPDWRAHATINVKYRSDAHGHAVPLKSDKVPGRQGFGHDKGHGH